MKKRLAAVLLLAVLGAVALWFAETRPERAQPRSLADADTLRHIRQGALIGFADDANTYAWLGIPYAQAPLGDLRWRAPRPAQPWRGTREALAFGAACPQTAAVGNGSAKKDYGRAIGAEDCLFLNVWTPRFASAEIPTGDRRLPVMVWIHGGGNVNGSSAMYPFVRNLADDYKLVMVSINYRLGLLGWFRHPALYGEDSSAEDRSGNYGTLDIVQALRWVRENIAAFGGDPERVTVFGESSGGFNVYSLLVSPRAKGLFQGAISQSGGLGRTPPPYAENYSDDPVPGHERSAREVVNRLLIQDRKAADRAQAKALQNGMDPAVLRAFLRSRSPAQLLAALTEDVSKTILPPALFGDGAVLPAQDSITLFRDASRYNAVPLIAGSNRDETKPFNLMNPEFGGLRFGLIPYVKDQDVFDRVSAYGSQQWKLFAVDEPLTVMRESQGAQVYGYRFDWDELPDLLVMDMSRLLGAAHAAEINFVFNAMQPPQMIGTFYTRRGQRERSQLARAMSSYWAEFAYTGKPGRGRGGDLPEWKAWDNGAEKFMLFDSPAGGGIRMSAASLTAPGLAQRLLDDRAKGAIASDEQLCRWYAELFVNSIIPAVKADPRDYAEFDSGACRKYPAAGFPGLSRL